MAEQTIPFRAGQPESRLKIERRALVRISSDQEVCCRRMGASIEDESTTRWLGTVRDISQAGIALILRREFQKGTLLSVELATRTDGLRRLFARVVHARWEMDGRWILGCTFLSKLSQEELQTLIRR